MMKETDLLIIGGGPAGLTAAEVALRYGLSVTIIERALSLGGQLVKQTHKFFGSEKQHAKTRGIDIATLLQNKLKPYQDHLTIELETTAVGMYSDGIVTTYNQQKYTKYHPKTILIATGASEKFLAFENNDLPGITGAGAVQTLMNQYGIMPGQEVVMVGSGNIGLIVSYQLIQAGVHVKCVLEAAKNIGGYLVHASKLRRLGVEIRTSHTVKRAIGQSALKAVEIVKLDDSWNPIEGSEEIIPCDSLCISVGLSPMHQLLSMAGAKMKFVRELGGIVPVVNQEHETSLPGVYVAGDAVGVEEASSAMVEGSLAGLMAVKKLLGSSAQIEAEAEEYHHQLDVLRSGAFGEKTRVGLDKLRREEHA